MAPSHPLSRYPLGRAAAGSALGVAIVVVGLSLNAAAFVVPFDFARLGDLAYGGVFVLTFVANASVVVPVPYVPIVIRVAEVAGSVPLVIAAAAAGSMLGESVSFVVGRAGKRIVKDSRVTRMLMRVAHRPVLASAVLFVVSAPPNPFFDVVGLAAGAFGLPYGMFAGAVFAGRCVRFGGLLAAFHFGLLHL